MADKMKHEIENISKAIDGLSPSEEQRRKMWQSIEAASAVESNEADIAKTHKDRKPAKMRLLRQIAVIAAAVVLVIVGIGGKTPKILDAESGYVYAAESRDTGMSAEEVLIFAGSPDLSGMNDVYAPVIHYLDDDILIFGSDMGMIIYDRTAKKVAGLIDMQAICSSYYNCDSVKTHAYVNDDKLIIYNTEGNFQETRWTRHDLQKPWGYYHIYDLGNLPGEATLLKYEESGLLNSVESEMYKLGRAYDEQHYVDAFNDMKCIEEDEMKLLDWGGSYSEFAYLRNGSDDIRNVIVKEKWESENYILVGENPSSGEITKEKIDLNIDKASKAKLLEKNKLPVCKFSGNDPAMAAIYEHEALKPEDIYYEGETMIPVLKEYMREEKDGELKIFAQYDYYNYVKRGNCLVSTSGGLSPACFYLKKTGGKYVVTKCEFPQDGEYYTQSIKEMTKGHPILYFRMISPKDDSAGRRKNAIRSYVESNNLDIKYYKDFGWDPIPLY